MSRSSRASRGGQIDWSDKRDKCIHRVKAGDIPRGMNPNDVVCECVNDSECPTRKNLRAGKNKSRGSR